MAYGQSGYLAINFQNSFGVSNTNSAYFTPLVSESITETINQIVEKNIYGRMAESPTHEGTHEIEGDIRTECHPILLGPLLKAVFGNLNSWAVGSAYYHEFFPASSDWDDFSALPPMTVEVFRDSGSSFLYYDLLGTSLAIEIAHGQLLTASMNVAGGKFTQKAQTTPSFHSGGPWTWDVTSATYDGIGIDELRQFSLVFDNHLTSQFTLTGGKYPFRIKRDGPQTVAVEGTMLFQDQKYFQEFQAQSEKSLVINFKGETIATSYNNELKIDIPRFRFNEFSPQLTGVGQIEVNFSGKGIYDPTSGYPLCITLSNTYDTY